MLVQPYLSFDGHCEEAIEFYRKALGAEMQMLMRFKEAPDPYKCQPGSEDKVMHMCFRIGDTALFASDGRCEGKPNFQGISLSLTAADDAEAERLFNALADGGQVQMPLAKTFFFFAFRHGCRPLWRALDGPRKVLRAESLAVAGHTKRRDP
jgi:PhnB protein